MNTFSLIEISLSVGLVLLGILIAFSKDIIKTVIFLSILSMLTALAFVMLKAPDVAITEIVIGSGLVTFLFLFTIKFSNKAGESE